MSAVTEVAIATTAENAAELSDRCNGIPGIYLFLCFSCFFMVMGYLLVWVFMIHYENLH